MKRNRASFFNESLNYYNTQMPGIMPNNNAMMGVSSYSNVGVNPMYNLEDLNGKIARLEREINRLEHRVSLLEQNNTKYTTEDIDVSANNMYMV